MKANRRSKVIGVGQNGRRATLHNALSDVASFGLSRDEAIPIARAMQKTVKSGWEDFFRSNARMSRSTSQMTAASNSKGRAALTAGKGRHQFKSSALLLSMVALPRSQTRSIWGRLESMLTVPRTRSPTLVSPCRTGTALTVPCATAISVASYWTARTLLFPTRPASTLLISACPGEFGMAWTSILRSTISMTSATGKPRTIWSLELLRLVVQSTVFTGPPATRSVLQ